jgi:uncharacterized protein
MSESNKAVLVNANAALDRGDIDGFLSCCADDLVWTAVGEMTLTGKVAVRQWMATAYKEPPEYSVADMVAQGEFVVALGDIMVQEEGGKSVRHSYCDVWRVRDGKVAELRAFVVNPEPEQP